MPPAGALLLPAALAGAAIGILLADRTPSIVGAAPVVALGGTAIGLTLVALRGHGRAIGLVVLAGILSVSAGLVRGDATRLPTGPGSVAGAIGRGELAIRGTVADEPRPREDRLQVVLDEIVVGVETPTIPLRGRLLAWLPRTAALRSGDQVALRAEVEDPPILEDFDYRAYLARQGIAAVARSFSIEVVGHRSGGPADALSGLRRGLADGVNDLVPEPEAAFGVGILLGIRSGIAPDLEEAFATAGLTHVVAISGWNIAIVTALAAASLRPLRRRPGGRWTEAGATIGVVVGYVILVGGSPSVVRAALMSCALLVARLGGTRGHAAGALALTALIMLVAAPPLLWDVGFQLSALATAGLLAFAGPLDRRLRFLPTVVREPVALTVAAQIATLPVVLGSFERLSLVAPLANVAVVPLVPLVMATAAVAAPVGMVLGGMAGGPIVDLGTWLAGGLAWLPLRALVVVGQVAGAVPLAAVPIAPPDWLPLAWYPLVVAAALRQPATDAPDPLTLGLAPLTAPRHGERSTFRAPPAWAFGVAALALLVVLTVATRPDGRTHVMALDIGQGDAILVVSPSGATALIDGGPDPERTLRALGAALPFHRRNLDLVVLTHPHQDHIAGLVDVLDRYRVGLTLEPGRPFDNPVYPRFQTDAAAEPGGRLAVARAGLVLRLDATTALTVLHPSEADAKAPLPDDDINNASVVLLLESGEFRALLTGDAELPVEGALLARGLLPPLTVLKVGHHGSESSTSEALLDATRPMLALISCGIDNEYGHPTRQTLDRLVGRGIGTLRTDLQGTVEVTSDGRRVEARAGGRVLATLALASEPATALPGTISAWRFPTSRPPSPSWPATTSPMGSWSTRAGWRGSRARRPRCWPRPGSRSTPTWSRWPRCSTTSTSWKRGARASRTASSARAGSPTPGMPSSPCRSPPTPSAACSMRTGSRVAGRRCWSRSPIAM